MDLQEETQQVGLFWHVHHEFILEWCHGYNERAEYIRTRKPKKEIDVRLRLFKAVKGELSKEVIEACKAQIEARKAYDEAWKAQIEARKAYDEAWKAYYEAWKAYYEAWKAYIEMRNIFQEILLKNKKEIEALHALECFNCPWDGKTIFPEKN